jgi:hypothetical protein
MAHDVLNLTQLFSIEKIGKNHNELICPLLSTVVVIIQLLQTKADTIGYIHHILGCQQSFGVFFKNFIFVFSLQKHN